MSPIVSAQVRGARGMLGWSMVSLAREAKVSVSTIKRIEDGETAISPETIGTIRAAFENSGVEFLEDDGCGIGLRFKPRRLQPSVFSRFM